MFVFLLGRNTVLNGRLGNNGVVTVEYVHDVRSTYPVIIVTSSLAKLPVK